MNHSIIVITYEKRCIVSEKVSFIFVETDLHLWSLSDCNQPSLWPLLRKTFRPLYTFLAVYTRLEATLARSTVSKCFLQVFKGFEYFIFFIKMHVPERRHFSAYRATVTWGCCYEIGWKQEGPSKIVFVTPSCFHPIS